MDNEHKTDAQQATEQQVPDKGTAPNGNLKPIPIIDTARGYTKGVFLPRALSDDPITGDGSSSRDGVDVSPRQLSKLSENRLHSRFEPAGNERLARKIRRLHEQSRKARKKNRRTVRKYIRLAVAYLVVASIIGCGVVGVTYALEMWGGVQIPYVMGDTVPKASELLEEKGFKVATVQAVSDTLEGHVVAVDPAQGERVEEGSTITLTVSQTRFMPEVVGTTREEARSILKSAGAKSIRYETRISMDNNDKIVESRPAAGAVFMSTEEITLVVAELPVVPNIVGEDESLAMTHLERNSVPAHVEYERARPEDRGRVIRTSPEADQSVGAEGATVYVGDLLIEVMRLSDYFDANGARISQFLQAEGYAPKMGHYTPDGRLLARFANADDVSVSFAKDPWSRSVVKDQTPYQQVMNEQTHIEGVRLTMPIKSTSEKGKKDATVVPLPIMGINNPAVDENTAREVMKLCGFDDIIGSCTQESVIVPSSKARQNTPFYCCYGEVGKYVWTVLIKGTSGTGGKVTPNEIVATCVPKSAYAEVDLKASGEKVCDYVAYQEMYVG